MIEHIKKMTKIKLNERFMKVTVKINNKDTELLIDKDEELD